MVDRVSMRKKLGLFSHTRYVQAVRLPPPDSRSKRLVKDRDLESRIAVIIRLYAALAGGFIGEYRAVRTRGIDRCTENEPGGCAQEENCGAGAPASFPCKVNCVLGSRRLRTGFQTASGLESLSGGGNQLVGSAFPAPRLPAPSIAQRRQLRRECT